MVARGYASLSFLHSAAEYIDDLDVPTYIYHLGDFDPSGVNAGEKIEQTLREMAPDADITFERIAVTPEQIETGTCRPGRPRLPTAGPRVSATYRSNSTPFRRTASRLGQAVHRRAPTTRRFDSSRLRKRASALCCVALSPVSRRAQR